MAVSPGGSITALWLLHISPAPSVYRGNWYLSPGQDLALLSITIHFIFVAPVLNVNQQFAYVIAVPVTVATAI